MNENFYTTNIDFYNYLLAKQKIINIHNYTSRLNTNNNNNNQNRDNNNIISKNIYQEKQKQIYKENKKKTKSNYISNPAIKSTPKKKEIKNKFINKVKNESQSNITEIKKYPNNDQSNNTIKNITVNKLKYDDFNINKFNTIFSKTKRDFHLSKPIHRRNYSSNFLFDNFNMNYYNQNKPKINDLILQYNNTINTNTIDNFSINQYNNNLYNIALNDKIINNFNRDKIIDLNLCQTEIKQKANYSRVIYNFKNVKMFYAHLELLLSLYLKRNFKFFIERIKSFDNLNLYNNTDNSRNQPIINVNNAHCSLFCSININKDNNDILNNNAIIPLKTIDNSLNRNIINNIPILNTNKKINLNKTSTKNNNKAVYIPKNKEKTKSINEKNSLKKSSPIKEMNINLKKMNTLLNQNSINNMQISNTKSNIYKRPKKNNNNKNNTSKKIIKEIKIKHKENVLTSYKKENKFLEKFKPEINNNIIELGNNISKLKSKNSNNNIKNIYIGRNNNNNEINMIKTNLFRNNSEINKNNFYATFIQSPPQEILVKKLITNDKRIFINIKYIILENSYNNISKNKPKFYNSLSLKSENILSLCIIKNVLIFPIFIDKKIFFTDIFSFDNDRKNNINSLFNFIKSIKNIIIKHIRKNIFKRYKKCYYLTKILMNNDNKILKLYFRKFLLLINKKKTEIKSAKNIFGIYHKINYNDDFNINNKIKNSKINIRKNKNIQYKTKPQNLIAKPNNIIYRNKNRKNKNLFSNLSCTYKYWNKEINITVHENKSNINLADSKKKNVNIKAYNKK